MADPEMQFSDKIHPTPPSKEQAHQIKCHVDENTVRNLQPIVSSIPKKPTAMPNKIPPHMRRINMRVTSPSDNLSPFSQKLMVAERHNAALKTIRPKSLKDVLLASKLGHGGPDRLASTTVGSECESAAEDIVMEEPSLSPEEDEEEDGTPPSPSKHHRP